MAKSYRQKYQNYIQTEAIHPQSYRQQVHEGAKVPGGYNSSWNSAPLFLKSSGPLNCTFTLASFKCLSAMFWVSEWLSLTAFSCTGDIGVHKVNTGLVIITYILESLSSLQWISQPPARPPAKSAGRLANRPVKPASHHLVKLGERPEAELS